MDWLEQAKNIAFGQKVRCDCPECGAGTNTGAAILNHNAKGYSLYCMACGYNPFQSKGVQTLADLARIQELNDEAAATRLPIELPSDFTTDIPLHGRLWLYSGGVRPDVWKSYGVGYSKKLDRVVLPVYDANDNLVWLQCRALVKGQKPKYLQPSRDKGGVIFLSKGKTGDTGRIVVVEDILSAIRVGETNTSASLLGTKLSVGQANTLSKYSRVTTWLDADKAGRNGAYAVRRSMGMLVDVDNIMTELDPKKYSNKHIQEILCQ